MEEGVKQARKNGYSYSEIAKITGKSKKFAWKHSKDVQFNSRGKKRYYQNVKGIVKQVKNQKGNLSIQKIRIIGHTLFDGTIYSKDYHSVVKYINSSRELVDQFIKDIKQVYGLNPTSLEVSKGKNNLNHYRVSFKSKLIYNDLMKYFPSYSTSNQKISIPKEIMTANEKIKLEFLRTFFEDEGSIGHTGRIMGDLKSKLIIKQITKLLDQFKLPFGVSRYKEYTGYMYKIYLLKSRDNLEKFYNLKLFDKAKITHGKNMGRKKLDVLKECIKRDSTIASRLVGH